ncbi:hypothetical protein A3Q56_05563 [Intoshia linei]|uniref:Uncharacterized protein n=1 Tax=Intoshia linei TaxID=1819745 RepID=A0A177AXG3_9BILA|nr:hypothetical protein A3Q56_05563 [Intoshia linei]
MIYVVYKQCIIEWGTLYLSPHGEEIMIGYKNAKLNADRMKLLSHQWKTNSFEKSVIDIVYIHQLIQSRQKLSMSVREVHIKYSKNFINLEMPDVGNLSQSPDDRYMIISKIPLLSHH